MIVDIANRNDAEIMFLEMIALRLRIIRSLLLKSLSNKQRDNK